MGFVHLKSGKCRDLLPARLQNARRDQPWCASHPGSRL